MTQPATTFSELVAELKADAVTAWAAVKADAVAVEHDIVPIIEADIVMILGQFKSLALSTVMNLATAEFQNLTGTQKMSQATTIVSEAIQAAGHTIEQVGLQDVGLLVQQSYNALASTVTAAKGA